jgi:hypothetical protein
MTLTKTQRELLATAIKQNQHMVCVIAGHITSRKNGGYGERKLNAAIALREAGLLEHLNTHKSTHQLCHRLGSDIGAEYVFRLTDAGRAAITEA